MMPLMLPQMLMAAPGAQAAMGGMPSLPLGGMGRGATASAVNPLPPQALSQTQQMGQQMLPQFLGMAGEGFGRAIASTPDYSNIPINRFPIPDATQNMQIQRPPMFDLVQYSDQRLKKNVRSASTTLDQMLRR